MLKKFIGVISTVVMVMFLTGCFASMDTFKYWNADKSNSIQTVSCYEPMPAIEVIKIREVVMFDWDSNEITDKGQAIIDKVAKIMNENPDINLHLEGYASSEGAEIYNQGLSQRRVDAVKVSLMMLGVKGERMESSANGETSLFGDLLNINRRTMILSVD
jgi:outer membrane protein OmpA-like peptidoglycan-associated protein